VLIVVLSTPFAPRAQVLASLTGTVTDGSNEAVPGVKVTVATATLERTALTGSDGRHQFHATRVDMGLARSVQAATTIVQIRISHSRSGEPCPATGFCVCTEHLADVIRVVKADRPPDFARLRASFVQAGEPSDISEVCLADLSAVARRAKAEARRAKADRSQIVHRWKR
jgi:hypothetical protein